MVFIYLQVCINVTTGESQNNSRILRGVVFTQNVFFNAIYILRHILRRQSCASQKKSLQKSKYAVINVKSPVVAF